MMNSLKSVRGLFVAALLPAMMLAGSILFSCTNSKVQDAADMAKEYPATEVAADAADSTYLFLIRAVDVNSKAVTEGDFLYIGDLPYSGRAESEYEGFVYPITRCVVTGHKDVIGKLAPAGAEYIIDDKKVSTKEFDALPAQAIEVVTLAGNQVV